MLSRANYRGVHISILLHLIVVYFYVLIRGKKYSLIIFITLLIIILFLSFKTLTLNEMTCLMRKWKVCCGTSPPQTDLIIKHTPETGGLCVARVYP